MIALEDFKSAVKDVARANRFMVVCVPSPFLAQTLIVPQVGGNRSVLTTGNYAISFLTELSNAVSGVSAIARILSNPQALVYTCKAASIPTRTLGVVEHKRWGLTRKVHGDPNWDDLDLTFLNDYNGSSRSFFELWQNLLITNPDSNLRAKANSVHGSTVVVTQLGRDGTPLAVWVFYDAWPKSINSIDFSMDSNDTPSEYSVSFCYNYWQKLL